MIRTRTVAAILLILFVAVMTYGTFISSLGCGGDAVGVEGLRVDFPEVAGPTGTPAVELAVELPDAPSAMMIYRVKQADVTPDAVADIGVKLGLHGEITTSTFRGRYTLCEESRCLFVWRASGAIEYQRKDEILFPLEAPTLPTKEEAKRIAIDFVDELDLSLVGAVVQDPFAGSYMSGPNELPTGEVVTQSYVCHWAVRFDCELHSVPLCGPGAKFEVRIGNNGEVGSMVRGWREVEPYEETSIKSPERALEELREGKGSHDAPLDCQEVILNGLCLAYWMEGLGEKQDYVVPVYVFLGESVGPDGKTQDFRGYVNAL